MLATGYSAVTHYLPDALTLIGYAESKPVLGFVTHKQYGRFGIIHDILHLVVATRRID